MKAIGFVPAERIYTGDYFPRLGRIRPGIWAIAASRHRSGVAARLSRFASQPFGRSSHIARVLPDRLTLLVCAAICVVTNIALWRI